MSLWDSGKRNGKRKSAEIKEKEAIRVTWNREEVLVKHCNVFPSPYLENKLCNFVMIRMKEAGRLTVEADCFREAKEIAVRPKSFGLSAERAEGMISVEVTDPCSFTVEPDGKTDNAPDGIYDRGGQCCPGRL